MLSITYMSTAVEPFDEDDLDDLLAVSRRNNEACGVTGMMLYADGHFIQTLEGPDDGVGETFARIALDPRHRDLVMTLREEVEERTFAEWTMGFERILTVDAEEIPGFNDFLAARTELERTAHDLGHAGIFHRIFRDRMR